MTLSPRLDQLSPPLMDATVAGLPLYSRGKVRDTFDFGDHLLMVATDRVSAFDVVLPNGIPDKGTILTQMSRWWFGRTSEICPNHLAEGAWPAELAQYERDWAPRSMYVRRADRIDIECVVRGYLAGSGWQEYVEQGTLAGLALPPGLVESDRLPEPRFTPSTKNDNGHDENISITRMAEMVGSKLTAELHQICLDLYSTAATIALERGVILADTKLEFGYIDGRIHLIDECFTPDSSRYWDAETYERGKPQPSMDKQFLRDWLSQLDWDKTAPGPELPEDVILGTRDRYQLAYRRVTGQELELGAR
ncbi:MAG TPA: phosphoribosylaminoimidazolesuccinocarboxamide synthase [Candidatus Solibacter sp.]|jgi:phosphoribosylaminoimidazole-succinocarboxamide synthase|nr:phosphoribosylaminoimidazolesuccinocarboxamide synthase [Candidatus Solibacter sp.]